MFASYASHCFTAALSAGRLLSNGFKTTPRIFQADTRVTSIVEEQLKKGIELPVINRITFNPATLVHRIGKQLEKGNLSYSYLKGDENSLLIFIHNLFNTRELIYSVNGTRKEFQDLLTVGIFFESVATIKNLAIQQEAKRAFIQFEPRNERLLHIISKKHPLVGHHPFYLANLARPMFLDKSPSPVFEITQAISKNRGYLHGAAGTPLITNSDCQSLQNEMRANDSQLQNELPINPPIPDKTEENKNQEEKITHHVGC